MDSEHLDSACSDDRRTMEVGKRRSAFCRLPLPAWPAGVLAATTYDGQPLTHSHVRSRSIRGGLGCVERRLIMTLPERSLADNLLRHRRPCSVTSTIQT